MALYILTVFLNKKWKLGLTDSDIQRTLGTFIFLSLFIVITLPIFIPMIKREFVRSHSAKVILVPIFLTIIVDYLIELSRYIPIFWGRDFVRVAEGQVINELPQFSITSFIFMAFFPAVLEEFVYRFLPFGGMKAILEVVIAKDYKQSNLENTSYLYRISSFIYDVIFIRKNKLILGILIILTSTLFSLLHIPDITNFYAYFISGVLFCFYYLKYGYLGAIVGHAMSNYLPFGYILANVTAEVLFGIKLN